MSTRRFFFYSAFLAAGAALVGLVIGFVIKTPPSSVAAWLVMAGLLLVTLAALLAWSGEKPNSSKKH